MEKENAKEKIKREDEEGKSSNNKIRVSLKQLVMYAGASGDFNEIHYNFESARKAGFSRPIVHGMLSFALCIKHIMNEKKITPDKIKRVRAKFLVPVELEEQIDFEIEQNDGKDFKVFLIKESGEKAVECEVEIK